jgi:hypothetical protein
MIPIKLIPTYQSINIMTFPLRLKYALEAIAIAPYSHKLKIIHIGGALAKLASKPLASIDTKVPVDSSQNIAGLCRQSCAQVRTKSFSTFI